MEGYRLSRHSGAPANYESAKAALARRQRIEECKTWADKAAALASYAKQADDKTLHTLAVRIQARALRRAGGLLWDFYVALERLDDHRGVPASSMSNASKSATPAE